jgi:hypothetical protein
VSALDSRATAKQNVPVWCILSRWARAGSDIEKTHAT